jgi:tetratricopeptide (TPR) repeat protein
MKTQTLVTRCISSLLVIGLALTHVGCQPSVCQKVEPVIVCPAALCAHRIETLSSPFPPLTLTETKQEWGKEILIGDLFAKERDFYRAITCYKRARALIPARMKERLLQIDYDLVLCYYLGNKYQDALNVFEASELSQANADFAAFHDLLLIVYDCYYQTKQLEKANGVLTVIRHFFPETGEDLTLYHAIKEGEVHEVHRVMAEHREGDSLSEDFSLYHRLAKSPQKARLLNAVLPGAGYYYVGQRKSALTSFLINTLFTVAAYQFFRNGYFAAGAITTSLEAGWYLGGINGAGIEAQEFNHRLYERIGGKLLTERKGFPILMFQTGF